MKRSKLLLGMSLLLVSAGGLVWADAKYAPSEVEDLKLKLAVSQVQNAQKDVAAANQALQARFSELGVIVEQVKADHKWPKETQYDLTTGQFQDPPKPEEKK